jgi:hypothetical protein
MLLSESPVRVPGVKKNRPEDWDRCISILPLKVFVPYSIFMEKTTCPMPDFNENNIENKTNKALRFLIEGKLMCIILTEDIFQDVVFRKPCASPGRHKE